jgi:predicted nuclease of restriction endonuclease-like RecB superfamily
VKQQAQTGRIKKNWSHTSNAWPLLSEAEVRRLEERLSIPDMNLVIPNDIPIYLEFLKTRAGQFTKGYAKWRETKAFSAGRQLEKRATHG